MNRPELDRHEREALQRVHALRERMRAQLTALEGSIRQGAAATRMGNHRGAREAMHSAAEIARELCRSTAPIVGLATELGIPLPPSREELERHAQTSERALVAAQEQLEAVIMANEPARAAFEEVGRARARLESARAALAAHDRKTAGGAL